MPSTCSRRSWIEPAVHTPTQPSNTAPECRTAIPADQRSTPCNRTTGTGPSASCRSWLNIWSRPLRKAPTSSPGNTDRGTPRRGDTLRFYPLDDTGAEKRGAHVRIGGPDILKHRMKKIAAVILFIVVVLPVLLLLVIPSTPTVSLPPAITAIGQSTPVPIQVHDPHGVRRIAVFIEQ